MHHTIFEHKPVFIAVPSISKMTLSVILFRLILLFSPLLIVAQAPAADIPDTTFDGLVRVKGSKVDVAYVKPGADFSVYKRVMIDLIDVRFKKGWERDHNEVNRRDQARIKEGLTKMFHDVFRKEIQEKGDMKIATRADDDVLAVRASIIDLDITAPDTMTSGRVRNYVTSAGEMSIVGELYDSVTGDILARIKDRKVASSTMRFTHSTRISNSQEARRALSSWARLLNDRLREIRDRKVAQE